MALHRVRFDASGFELFVLYFKNMLLSVITLGVYSFWARVKVSKFIFQHTYFMEESFDYHATGKEKFIGFLKAVGILAMVGLFFAGIYYSLVPFLDPSITQIILMLLACLLWLLVFPILLVGARRFLLSRTSYRGLRFRFSGQISEIYKELLIGTFLTLITLGVYAPWLVVKLQKFLHQYTSYGNAKFSFDAAPKELLKIYLVGYLFTFLTLGIYVFWLEARVYRYFAEGARFNDVAFECNLTGGQLFVTFLYVMMISAVTLGFGLPWAVIREYEVLLGSIAYPADIDFDQILSSEDKGASALADGMSEAADALSSVAGMFG